MRILIIHRNLPFPADDGGKLRRSNVARFLARDHDVALACFADEDTNPDFPEASQFSEVKLIDFPKPPSRLRKLLSPIPSEVMELNSPEMAAYVTTKVKHFAPDVILVGEPTLSQYAEPYPDRVRVLDYVMVMTLAAERYAAISIGLEKWLWKLRRQKLAAHHRKVAPQFDLCCVNSLEDHADLMQNSPAWRAEFLPSGLALDEYPLGLAEVNQDTMLYAGSVKYGPNLDAVNFFANQILPQIRNEVPNARLLVTGAVPTDGSAPQAPGLEYTGYLDDVRPTIAGANVCVVPLRSGAGGGRFKVLESLALGTPMVSTDIGAEGVEVTDGQNIMLANDPTSFARRTIELMTSDDLREKVSKEGRRLIEEKYSWSKLGARITDMIENIRHQKQTIV